MSECVCACEKKKIVAMTLVLLEPSLAMTPRARAALPWLAYLPYIRYATAYRVRFASLVCRGRARPTPKTHLLPLCAVAVALAVAVVAAAVAASKRPGAGQTAQRVCPSPLLEPWNACPPPALPDRSLSRPTSNPGTRRPPSIARSHTQPIYHQPSSASNTAPPNKAKLAQQRIKKKKIGARAAAARERRRRSETRMVSLQACKPASMYLGTVVVWPWAATMACTSFSPPPPRLSHLARLAASPPRSVRTYAAAQVPRCIAEHVTSPFIASSRSSCARLTAQRRHSTHFRMSCSKAANPVAPTVRTSPLLPPLTTHKSFHPPGLDALPNPPTGC